MKYAKEIADALNIAGLIWILVALVPTWFNQNYFSNNFAISVAALIFAAQVYALRMAMHK